MSKILGCRVWAAYSGIAPSRWWRIPSRAPARGIAVLAVVLMVCIAGAGLRADTGAPDADVTVLLRRAEGGDARAAFLLGMRYARPDDASRDDSEAVRWLRQAAEQGLAEAQYNLGIMYANGRGVARDAKEAARWYGEAAEQGLAEAQYNLGAQYAVGDGVPRDGQRAAMLFEQAALQDIPEAAYNLGVLYDLGRGVEPDARAAMQWYAHAAERGYHPAASRLAALRAANPSLASDEPQPDKSESGQEETANDAGESRTAMPTPDSPLDTPAEKASEPDAPADTNPARSASVWLARFEPDHYTVQVLSHTDEASVRRYLEDNFEDGEAGYFAFELDGRTWYSVVYGDFSSYAQATAAGARLAERMSGVEPWVRRFAVIQAVAIR
jgi:TPR repeat protein